MSYLDMLDGKVRFLNYSGNGRRDNIKRQIAVNFEVYGKHEPCKSCNMDCIMYDAPTLKLICPMTPDYATAARARGAANV